MIIGAGRGGREGGMVGSLRWGCAGSQGPGNDEPGGVGDEPRCSAWLMREKLASFSLPSYFHFNFLSPFYFQCFFSLNLCYTLIFPIFA